MISACDDLNIPAVLADPMIRILMAADGVDRHAFERLLRDKAEALHATTARPQAAPWRVADGRARGWLPQVCFA